MITSKTRCGDIIFIAYFEKELLHKWGTIGKCMLIDIQRGWEFLL